MRVLVRQVCITAAIAIVAVSGVPDGAGAATFTVNGTADSTDGSCAASVGGCTLREAIQAAVALAGRDTIRFDPAVFSHGSPAIVLGSVLPVIADPAGTVVDGAGAFVRILGNGAADGLVFASADGVPLVKVTVANLRIQNFTGDAIHICGGVPPDCEADVTGALVRNVYAGAAGFSAIRISGRVISKPRILDSVTFIGGVGVFVRAKQTLTGARVQNCLTSDHDGGGVQLDSLGANVGSVIVDSVATTTGTGLQIFGATVEKPKVTNAVAHDTTIRGVSIFANGNTAAVQLSKITASQNDFGGILMFGDVHAAPKLTDVVVEGSGTDGLLVEYGPGTKQVTAPKLTRVVAVANSGNGAMFGTHTVAGAKLADATFVHNGSAGLRMIATGTGVKDVAASSNGTGLLLETGSSGTRIEKSRVLLNTTGIDVADGASGNVVQGNVALGNAVVDLIDRNMGCDGNTWTDNVFLTADEACVH